MEGLKVEINHTASEFLSFDENAFEFTLHRSRVPQESVGLHWIKITCTGKDG